MLSRLSAGFAACAISLTPLASAQATQKRSLLPVDSTLVLPLQHQNQLDEIAAFERARLQVPEHPGDIGPAAFTVAVPWDGQTFTLDLRRRSVRAAGFEVLEHRADDSLVAVPPGEIRTFTGSVREDKNAVVAGSLLRSGFEAEIRFADGRVVKVEPDFRAFERGDRSVFLVFDQRDLVVDEIVKCDVDARSVPLVAGAPEGVGCGGDHCVAQLALDLDYSFYEAFAFSTSLATDQAEYITLVANLQYLREVGIDHRLTTVIVRTSLASEPAGYASSGGTGDLLTAMKAYWDANHGAVVRDLAQVLTNRHAGGTAFVGTVCNIPFAYGANGPAFGFGLRCIANVLAHEMGHNWNADHCACSAPGAEYTMNGSFPPCPLRFNPTETQPEIRSYRDSVACLTPGAANDEPSEAIPLALGVVYGSNSDATADGSSSCTASYPDVWYVYKPAVDGTLTVDTCGGLTNFDTILTVFDGSVDGGLVELDCDDDSCGLRSQASTPVTAGTTYFVKVSGFSGATGFFELNVSGPVTAAPINDLRADAILVGPGTFSGNTTGATADVPGATCGSSDLSPDVWYRYIPREAGLATFDTCEGSTFDTVLGLFDANGAELVCNDDWCFALSRIEYPVTAGSEYFVRVSGFNGEDGGYRLSISGPEAWNTVCTSTLEVPLGTARVSFYGAYETDGDSSCGPFVDQPDYFFSWTNTTDCAGTLTVTTCGTNDLCGVDTGVDTVLSIHSSCPADLGTELVCNDDAFGSCANDLGNIRDSSVSAPVAIGETLVIRLSRFSSFQGRGVALLNVSFAAGPAPGNDACASAFAVGDGTVMGSLCASTNDGSSGCGLSASAPDVWYSYQASETGTLIATTCGTHDLPGLDLGVDTVLGVHSSGCPATLGTLIDCNDDITGFCEGLDLGLERDSAVMVPVIAGTSYLIRVSSFQGAFEGPFLLHLQCVSGTPYCDSLPNATGFPARLTATGSPSSSLELTSAPVPNTTGQFFFGPMMLAGGSNLGDGLRCVGGSTTRLLPFVNAGMMMQPPNTAIFTINYTAPYAAGLTGTKYFQHWFRSGLATGSGSNASDALAITF